MRDESSSKQIKVRVFNQSIAICYRSLFVISLLILSSITFPTPLSEPVDTESYLIEFTLPPLIETLSDESKSLGLAFNMSFSALFPKIVQIRQNITLFHQQAISQIASITNQEFSDQNLKQYHLFFNGIWIDKLTDRSIKSIEQLPFVNRIEKDTFISISNEMNQLPSLTFISLDHQLSNTTTVINDLSKYSGKNVSIAFFDTGIDHTHPALSPIYKGGYDFVNEDDDPYDDQGHGTHVAGITAAQPTITSTNQQITGIASNSSVFAYKVLDENGEGYTSWFLSAFERAMDPNQDGNFSDHHDIISISAGNPDGSVSDLMSTAATQAVNAGITVIAAAGNNGPTMNTISSPAIAKQVIAVGASIENTRIAPYSSRGTFFEDMIKPDIIAPGHQIISTWPNNQYETLSGTSMATPYVTGIVACLLEQNPTITPNKIQQLLHNHAISKGYNASIEGYGFISTNQPFNTQIPLDINLSIIQPIDEKYVHINLSLPQLPTQTPVTIKLCSVIQEYTFEKVTIQQQIDSAHTIIQIPTKNLSTGWYLLEIKLDDDQFHSQLRKHVFIENTYKDQIIYPQVISESETFTCTLTNDTSSKEPFFIFYVPFRSIQLKRGSTVTFTAPTIPVMQKETRKGMILTLIPTFPPTINRHSITIVNTDTS